jgi:hypothetical protein
MYQWNAEYKCVVDYMGLPISRTEAITLKGLLEAHLLNSAKQLAAAKVALAHERHPDLAHNVSHDPEPME